MAPHFAKEGNCWGLSHYSPPYKKLDLFRLCPPPSTLCSTQLQSTCHYIVNHHVKIWHVRLGGANNMHPLSWGGGGTNGKDPRNYSPPLWYNYHDWWGEAIGYLATKLGGDNGKDPIVEKIRDKDNILLDRHKLTTCRRNWKWNRPKSCHSHKWRFVQLKMFAFDCLMGIC